MTHSRELADHLRYFSELGVTGASRDPRWRERTQVEPPAPAAMATDPAPDSASDPAPSTSEPTPVASYPAPGASDSALAPPDSALAPPDSAPATPNSALAPSDSDDGARPPGSRAAQGLAALRAEIGDCTRCKLCTLGRRQVVFGVGNPDADLMFVGEAPGADEDVQGKPFVGRAGQLLTKIIESIGLRREDVYIANVIKCRPPANRNPEPDEVATCQPFLFRQIDLVQPKVIVALGTFAAHALLQSDAPISRLRGHVHHLRGAKLIPTFHPAFLLRSPDRKRDVWEDMKKVRALLADAD